jgi:G3E family GTPase
MSLGIGAQHVEEQKGSSPIPVTVLAGFLGAGKTTLLNRILEANHGRRVAVLVNDFGQINIDVQLLNVGPAGKMISLPNGCICCTLFTSVIKVIQTLLQQPELPEHILIEASGVSTPENVASILTAPSLQPYVVLDSLITIVDAENVRKIARAVSFIEDQISSADILLVNKIDLVAPAELLELINWIRGIAPQVRLVQTTYAEVPLALILGESDRSKSPGSPFHVLATPAEGHEHAHQPAHDQVYSTWTYTTDKPLRRRAVEELLHRLPVSIYRAKGILYLSDAPHQRYVLQMVGQRLKLYETGPWGVHPSETQLVFIGEPGALAPVELQSGLNNCLAENTISSDLS